MTQDRLAEALVLLMNPDSGEGLLARLRVVIRPGDGEVRATCAAAIGPEVQESCRRAALVVLGAEQSRRTVDWELELEGGRAVELHGRSLTAAFAVALYAASAGRAVPADVGITGDMDLSGALRPVGGLPAKARAAWARGLRVIAPAGGPEAAPIGGPILLVTHLTELRQALWPEAAPLTVAQSGWSPPERATSRRVVPRWAWRVAPLCMVVLVLMSVGLVPGPEAPAPAVRAPDEGALKEEAPPSPSAPPTGRERELPLEPAALERARAPDPPMPSPEATSAPRERELPVEPAARGRPTADEADPAQRSLADPPALVVCVLRMGAPLLGEEVRAGDALRLSVRAPGPGRLRVESLTPDGATIQLFPVGGEPDWIDGERMVPAPDDDALIVTPPAGEERVVVRWRPDPRAVQARGVGRGSRGDGCASARWLEGAEELVVTLGLRQVDTLGAAGGGDP
jgi:hypothetical protein